MSCLKLLTTNYVDKDLLANSYVSSEQAAYPVDNAYNFKRRSKVWRSNGHFQVTTSNNKLVFRDASGGSDKIASIAAGEYSSTNTFLAAVDAALEASGLANYTVTLNPNLKIVIASDLSGGATAFELRCTHVNFTAANLLGFDTGANRTGASSYTGDFLRINSDEWLLFDMGISTNPMHFAMTGSRNRALKLSPSGVFKIEGNHTNNFTSPVFSQTLSYDDEVIAAVSSGGLAPVACRYWRILFQDQNPLGFIEIGAFFLGDSFEPERGAASFPLTSEFIDRSETVLSENGQSFSEIKDQTQGYKISWKGLTKNDMEEITRFFRIYGTAKPFFVSLDTGAAFSSTFNRGMKIVKFSNEPSWELVSFNNFSCEMQLREEL